MPDWYRHRVVRHRLLPEVRYADDPRVAEAFKLLRPQAEADMALYLRSHQPGQMLETEFVHQRAEGLQVFVVITLFGPQEIKTEVLEEMAKRGEI